MLPRDMKVEKLVRSFPDAAYIKDDPLLKKILKQKIRDLSGGERRFLEISLLFSLQRDYILLDEPFTGVEPRVINRNCDRIKEEAKKNRGILLTDHMHQYVTEISDDAYLLHNRQCYRLRGDLSNELKKIGYIKQKYDNW